MKVLVTGAAGFVGSHLLPRLAAGGHEVLAHDLAQGDLAEAQPGTHGVQAVVHLAARSSVPESWQDPPAYYRANVLATANILEYCRRTRARLILVSSYVYGRPRYLPIDENHPLEAFNPYGHSKILAEETARFYEKAFGLRVAIVRPFNLFGPGQSESFLIPTLIRQVLDPSLERIEVLDARPRRDFLFIDDFADLLVRLVESSAAGVFNAGSGISTSISELAGLLCEIAGVSKPLADLGRPRADEVLDMYASVERATLELGWRPATPLRQGLERTLGAAVRPASES